jgi:stringent starvation protein B
MTPTRPYLIRAFYDWILDNGMTPYMLVDATVVGTQVPAAYVKEGRIVLNVAPAAVTGMRMETDAVTFSARFGGIAQGIRLPSAAVMAVYARENGQGMFFGDEEVTEASGATDELPPDALPPRRPALRVVK